MTPPWRIRYYISEDGTIPFKDFIGRLRTRQEQVDCYICIEILRWQGGTLYGHVHLTHTSGLHEIRYKSIHIFYVFDGDKIVIIDGLLPGYGKEHFDAIRRKAEDYASDD